MVGQPVNIAPKTVCCCWAIGPDVNQLIVWGCTSSGTVSDLSPLLLHCVGLHLQWHSVRPASITAGLYGAAPPVAVSDLSLGLYGAAPQVAVSDLSLLLLDCMGLHLKWQCQTCLLYCCTVWGCTSSGSVRPVSSTAALYGAAPQVAVSDLSPLLLHCVELHLKWQCQTCLLYCCTVWSCTSSGSVRPVSSTAALCGAAPQVSVSQLSTI